MTYGPKPYRTPGLDSYLQPDDDMPAEFYELVGECAAEIETDPDRVSCLLDASEFRELDMLEGIVVAAQNLVKHIRSESQSVNIELLVELEIALEDSGADALREKLVQKEALRVAEERWTKGQDYD